MLSLFQTIDLQDHLLAINHELDRLQTLLGDASDLLTASFHGALSAADGAHSADAGHAASDQLAKVKAQLHAAVGALQFQDMSSQLLGHTQRRLLSCIDTLANSALADDEDGAAAISAAPLRPNPVAQAEMRTGSIELF